jgi:hypothetical protein
MRRVSKVSTAAVAAVAAMAIAAGTSFAAPPDREGGGGRERGVSVEKSEAPREASRDVRRGERGVNGGVRNRERSVGVRERDGDGVRSDRRNRDWRRPGHRDRIVRGHRYNWGPGISFYFADGYYYGECGWLKRRAIETGSRMWWRRFQRCRDFS